jgi:hypothetical protein
MLICLVTAAFHAEPSSITLPNILVVHAILLTDCNVQCAMVLVFVAEYIPVTTNVPSTCKTPRRCPLDTETSLPLPRPRKDRLIVLSQGISKSASVSPVDASSCVHDERNASWLLPHNTTLSANNDTSETALPFAISLLHSPEWGAEVGVLEGCTEGCTLGCAVG